MFNTGLYLIEGFSNGNNFTPLYCISKELNIPPLSSKYAITQVKCFKIWKNLNCIVSNLQRDIPCYRRHE